MVPSDPIHSTTRHRHARHRALHSGVPGALPVCSPSAVFAGFRINAFRRTAIGCDSRTGPDARNGLSLACNSSRFHGLHSRVKVPGLLLRVLANRFRRPFGPSAPQPRPVRPDPGCFSAWSPLQPSPLAGSIASPASTPLWDFWVPPDQSVQPDPQSYGPPSEPARSPVAPRSRNLLLVNGHGSPFRVRYVFGGLLFLKPLGTSPNMPPKWFPVNGILYVTKRFQQKSWTCIFNGLTKDNGA